MITFYHHLSTILSGEVSKQSAELNQCDSGKTSRKKKKINFVQKLSQLLGQNFTANISNICKFHCTFIAPVC